MAERNYWVVSPSASGPGSAEQWRPAIERGYAIMGWSDDDPDDSKKSGKRFKEDIKIGDCIIVAQGANKQKELFIAGIVKTDAKWERLRETPWDAQNRQLRPFITKDRLDELAVRFDNNNAFGESSQPVSIYPLNINKWASDKRIIDILEPEFRRLEMKENLNYYLDLLTKNSNLILTGAPGTGKTYLAKQIAMQMIGVKNEKELEESGRFEFVQFHPSYDYTDFVEGLRPVDLGNGNIGFKLKSGIFKKFCHTAQISEKLRVFLDDAIKNQRQFKQTQQEGNEKVFYIDEQDDTSFRLRLDNDGFDKTTIQKKDMIAILENIDKINSADDIKHCLNQPDGSGSKDYNNRLILNGLLPVLKDEIKKNQVFPNGMINDKIAENVGKNAFVFIIDEINRGEISKIFGELFFSIDPGYRGINGAVKTQYSNMQTKPNGFDKELKSGNGNYGHFYIPENVYIIGTMNDIDRSVESFDFAMRRRFTWKEIKANKNTGMLSLLGDKEKEATDRLISLNNAIWDDDKTTDKGIEGLNSSYHIGASYSLKLKNYKDEPDPFAKLWEYHLEPLLKEYLRGRPDAETRLTDLENAYNVQASTKANKPENQESVANVDANNNTNI